MTEKEIDNLLWSELKYFKKEEFNYPDEFINNGGFVLLQKLDEFREFVGKPIIIHSDFRPGDKGQHGKARAVDIHIKGMHIVDQFLCAERSGFFKGIGVYPEWNSPGLHLDIRKGSSARWGCWAKTGDKENIYVPLDMPFFRTIFEKENKNVQG